MPCSFNAKEHFLMLFCIKNVLIKCSRALKLLKKTIKCFTMAIICLQRLPVYLQMNLALLLLI